MAIYLWAALACLLVTSRSFVATAPTDIRVTNDIKENKSQIIDEAVQELESLKPAGREVAVMKTQSLLFSNVNGKEEQHLNKDQLFEKDGKLVARISEKIDKEGDKNPRVKTELDIPSRNIHKVLEKEVEPNQLKTSRPIDNMEQKTGHSRLGGLQYSPQDLAEYVFWTGDERGATGAVEDFIQDGTLSREDAINFLEEIKRDLETIKAQYIQHEEDNAYNRKQQDKYQMGPELSEIRQQIKENFNKKADYQDTAPLQSLTEEDYEELVERLKMADLMYNEYSLEEIIYQLAKIMFRQSLSRGSSEAQDSLQKFTDFLENEAQSGRISRSLEKKVLGKQVTKRWSNLRDAFMKSKRKLKECKRSGAPKIKKYVYADQMQFLNKSLQTREVAESLEGATDTNEDEDVEALSGSPLPRKETIHQTTEPQEYKRRRRPDELELKTLKILEEPTVNPHMSFFQGLLPHLYKFDDSEILEFQMGVLEVINKINLKRRNTVQQQLLPPRTPAYYPSNYSFPQYQSFPTNSHSNQFVPINSLNPITLQTQQFKNLHRQKNITDSNHQQACSSKGKPLKHPTIIQYYQHFGQPSSATSPEIYLSRNPSPAGSMCSDTTYDFS